jgi:carbonic anhydrase
MNTIDYAYRFDPKNPSTKPPPADAEVARRNLEDGNRMFARASARPTRRSATDGRTERIGGRRRMPRGDRR